MSFTVSKVGIDNSFQLWLGERIKRVSACELLSTVAGRCAFQSRLASPCGPYPHTLLTFLFSALLFFIPFLAEIQEFYSVLLLLLTFVGRVRGTSLATPLPYLLERSVALGLDFLLVAKVLKTFMERSSGNMGPRLTCPRRAYHIAPLLGEKTEQVGLSFSQVELPEGAFFITPSRRHSSLLGHHKNLSKFLGGFRIRSHWPRRKKLFP